MTVTAHWPFPGRSTPWCPLQRNRRQVPRHPPVRCTPDRCCTRHLSVLSLADVLSTLKGSYCRLYHRIDLPLLDVVFTDRDPLWPIALAVYAGTISPDTVSRLPELFVLPAPLLGVPVCSIRAQGSVRCARRFPDAPDPSHRPCSSVCPLTNGRSSFRPPTVSVNISGSLGLSRHLTDHFSA